MVALLWLNEDCIMTRDMAGMCPTSASYIFALLKSKTEENQAGVCKVACDVLSL